MSREGSNAKFVVGLAITAGLMNCDKFNANILCDPNVCRLILDAVCRRKSVHSPERPYQICRTLLQLLNWVSEENIVDGAARKKIPYAQKYLNGALRNLNHQRKLYDANRRVLKV